MFNSVAQLSTSTQWSREDGLDLPIGAVQNDTFLVLRNVRLSDSGLYSCLARSSFGEAKLYATLIIEGPPGTWKCSLASSY